MDFFSGNHHLWTTYRCIAGGMGTGLARRLQQKSIQALITKESSPDQAVQDFLNGKLITEPFEPHEHGHEHGHHRDD